MTLLDDIGAAQRRPGPKGCGVSSVLASLDAKDRADLEAALADPTYQGQAIARALTARGFDVAGLTVQRHRNGVCCRG